MLYDKEKGVLYKHRGIEKQMHLFANMRVQKAMFISVAASLFFLAFVFSLTTNTISNVSAVETNEVGVYWNPACTDNVASIEWGTLAPGRMRDIRVYIRNEVDEPQFLFMSTENWDPSNASHYITLRWNYTRQRIDPDEVLEITLTLSVSRYIKGISNFRFNILIAGSQNLPGDINGNGIIDLGDVGKLDLIYSGFITDPELVARADINGDGIIDLGEVGKLEFMFSGVI